MSGDWPNSAEQAKWDVTALLEEGSYSVRAALTMYARSLLENRSGAEEGRVELAILNGWTVGVPVYRMDATYPPESSNPGSIHGEPAFTLLPQNRKILIQETDEPK